MTTTKTIKIEIHLTKSQKQICYQTFGVLRYLWNEFIIVNQRQYSETKHFMFGYEFAKYVNNELVCERPWIKTASNKARKDLIMHADKALRQFLQKKRGFIRLKRKSDRVQSFFFIKDGIRFLNDDYSHLWIPILHSVKLKERYYLKPDMISHVTSGRIIHRNDRWYVSLVVADYQFHEPIKSIPHKKPIGMGIDLGIKSYATIYNGKGYISLQSPWNVNQHINLLEDRIKSLQRAISHKEEYNLKKYGYESRQNIKKEDATKIFHTQNILKLRKRITKMHARIHSIMEDYIKKVCHNLVRTKPDFIVIEDLSVQSMLIKGSHKLADHIQKNMFRYFRVVLDNMCDEYGIYLIVADQYFPSSKTCSKCGHKKKELKLSTRVYKCNECGNNVDRDLNAAINLYQYGLKKIAAA